MKKNIYKKLLFIKTIEIMKKTLLILFCLPILVFGQLQSPGTFTAQADPVNVMPISFTTDSLALMPTPAGGDTLIITDWHWDFGDGTTDSIQNPTHSWGLALTYLMYSTQYLASSK